MATESIERTNRNAAGTVSMLIATVGYSLVPFLVASANGSENPFLFSAALRLGVAAGLSLFLLVFFRSILFRAETLVLVARRVMTWSMLCIIINQFVYGLFAWSTRFIDISVAAVLFEVWPILLILVTAFLFRGQRRYRKITPAVMTLLVLGFLGFAFVAISETEGWAIGTPMNSQIRRSASGSSYRQWSSQRFPRSHSDGEPTCAQRCRRRRHRAETRTSLTFVASS